MEHWESKIAADLTRAAREHSKAKSFAIPARRGGTTGGIGKHAADAVDLGSPPSALGPPLSALGLPLPAGDLSGIPGTSGGMFNTPIQRSMLDAISGISGAATALSLPTTTIKGDPMASPPPTPGTTGTPEQQRMYNTLSAALPGAVAGRPAGSAGLMDAAAAAGATPLPPPPPSGQAAATLAPQGAPELASVQHVGDPWAAGPMKDVNAPGGAKGSFMTDLTNQFMRDMPTAQLGSVTQVGDPWAAGPMKDVNAAGGMKAGSLRETSGASMLAEMDKLAAAIALGVELAEDDLLGLRKQAFETAMDLRKMAAHEEGWALRHPYASTLWGPLAGGIAGGAALGPAGTVAGSLGTEIAGTHYLSKAIQEERKRRGKKGEAPSFAVRHPYFTGIGSRVGGALAGAGVGGLSGLGLGFALGGPKEIEVPGIGRLPAALVGALVGGALGSFGGELGGRALGTRAIMRGHEREMGHEKTSQDQTPNLTPEQSGGLMAGVTALPQIMGAGVAGLGPAAALGAPAYALGHALVDKGNFLPNLLYGDIAERISQVKGQPGDEPDEGWGGYVGRTPTPPKVVGQGGGEKTSALQVALDREKAAIMHVMTKQAVGLGGYELDTDRIREFIQAHPELVGAGVGGLAGAGIGAAAGGEGRRGRGAAVGGLIGAGLGAGAGYGARQVTPGAAEHFFRQQAGMPTSKEQATLAESLSDNPLVRRRREMMKALSSIANAQQGQ